MTLKTHSELLNEIVMNAADIMETKLKFNQEVINILEKKRDLHIDTINVLKTTNKQIIDAIEVMRKNEGCWV